MKAPVRPDETLSFAEVGLQMAALAWMPWLVWAETMTAAKPASPATVSEKPPAEEMEFEFVP